jgi:hypothetical protein
MQNLRVVLDAQWIMGSWVWNLKVTEEPTSAPVLMHALAGGSVQVAERESELAEALALLVAVTQQAASQCPLPGVG